MRPREIEMWALRVIDLVRQRKDPEDVRVELKAQWPREMSAAARRIAGHANAARGEPILWLIGLDQKRGIVVLEDSPDHANWYEGVKAQFQGLAPPMQDVTLSLPGGQVVAIAFETDSAPYVVRNPEFGKPNGGPVALEVPWREATSVRSATRTDLLRLLEPTQRLPELEVLSGTLLAGQYDALIQTPPELVVRLILELYVIPPSNSRVVFPFHKCSATVQIEGLLDKPSELIIDMNLGRSHPDWNQESWSTPNELVMGLPGLAILKGYRKDPPRSFDATKYAVARVQLAVVGAANVLSQELTLLPFDASGRWARWLLAGGSTPTEV